MNALAHKVKNSVKSIKSRLSKMNAQRAIEHRHNGISENNGLGKTTDVWAERHLDPHYWKGLIHWGQLPQVEKYINRKITGSSDLNYIGYTAERYFKPLREKGPIRMMSLCCGIGQFELTWLKQGIVDQVIGYDVSQACIDAANQSAQADGLQDKAKFIQFDLNNGEFADSETFDVILNQAALHHVENLEHLLAECRKVSTDHTVFINHDYIGPNHHQWTEKQLEYINKVMTLLPDSLKESLTNPGVTYQHKSALSMEEMLRLDPSEGVRAKDITKVMDQYFEISDYKPFGGTILHVLLNDIAGNFATPEHAALLDLLILLEESLINEGVLESDFAYWVARPR